MKTCFKCGTSKPFTEFYAHPRMADGYLGKCKECTKADVRKQRADNVEVYRQYDRWRYAADAKRRENCRSGISSPERSVRYKAKYPSKRQAHIATGSAIRDGRLKRLPCEKCGNPKSQAHHDDYSKPFDVRWLCVKHHNEHHKAERMAKLLEELRSNA